MSAIEDRVANKILRRAELGLRKYGLTMERSDLFINNWLQHAQDEAMDLCVYLERLMREYEAQRRLINQLEREINLRDSKITNLMLSAQFVGRL